MQTRHISLGTTDDGTRVCICRNLYLELLAYLKDDNSKVPEKYNKQWLCTSLFDRAKRTGITNFNHLNC